MTSPAADSPETPEQPAVVTTREGAVSVVMLN